ncbi:rod shape-determining protein RodA [Patescibacteria group bacterium]|nr:rod shape-determining protein RodA [Patescibacteria group bacterium]
MQRFLVLFERLDWGLLIAAASLVAIGLSVIYGIGISRDPIDLFSFYKQLAALAIGVSVALVLTIVDYRHLRSLSVVIYLVGLALLVSVLIFGKTIRGTQGWFVVGGFSFQPVEPAKICLAAYLAAFMARHGHGRLSWPSFLRSAATTFIYIALVFLQPDFGSAMVMLAVWGAMALFAGLPRFAWIILPVIAAISMSLAWTVGLKPYQKERIIAFVHPTADVRGSGYNAAQARIAIGSGGWLGKGIGEGSQARLRFLPEAATDFIFAVVGEELGFVGIAVTILLFGWLFTRYVLTALASGDDFAALLLIGLGASLLVHVVENAGMNLGILPITGIPLPFVSSAASSLVVVWINVGLVQSVAVRRRSTSLAQAELQQQYSDG